MPENIALVCANIEGDIDAAKRIRAELNEAFGPILDILNRAKARGIDVNFQMGPDAIGRIHVAGLKIIREL